MSRRLLSNQYYIMAWVLMGQNKTKFKHSPYFISTTHQESLMTASCTVVMLCIDKTPGSTPNCFCGSSCCNACLQDQILPWCNTNTHTRWKHYKPILSRLVEQSSLSLQCFSLLYFLHQAKLFTKVKQHHNMKNDSDTCACPAVTSQDVYCEKGTVLLNKTEYGVALKAACIFLCVFKYTWQIINLSCSCERVFGGHEIQLNICMLCAHCFKTDLK